MNLGQRFKFALNMFYSSLIAKSVIDPDGLGGDINKTVKEIINENKTELNDANKKFGKVVDSSDFNNKKEIERALIKTEKIVTTTGSSINKKDALVVNINSEDVYKKTLSAWSGISGIDYIFGIKDKTAIKRINKFQNIFIYDHYKDDVTKRITKKIRALIKEEEGALDSVRFARKLKREFKSIIHQKNYFNVVVNQVLNNSRNYSSLNFYNEAEIKSFTVLSVLDERTSDICVQMDGKVLEVEIALDKYKDYDKAKTKEEVKEVNPWLDLLGDVVSYKNNVIDGNTTGADLQAMGINSPPYHALCRSTITPNL